MIRLLLPASILTNPNVANELRIGSVPTQVSCGAVHRKLLEPISACNLRRLTGIRSSNRARGVEHPSTFGATETPKLLHIPAPEVTLPRFAATVRKHMDVVRRANSFEELTSSGVQFKSMQRRRRINRTSILTEVMAVPKRDWMKAVENMADEKYPAWRAHLRATGKRLPAEVAEGLQQRSTWLALRPRYVKGLLALLAASDEPSLVDEFSRRLDAVMEFVNFVTQEFLLRNFC
jgi:hypothetical protein